MFLINRYKQYKYIFLLLDCRGIVMSRAFFYRERRLTFVMLSLVGWFGLLGLFGPYLPANAMTTDRQITFNMYGNQLTGHWSKKNGRWHFLKISKISKLKQAKRNGFVPRTTASISPSTRRKVKKKALRAALADEIGRWSKIGNRWEWRLAETIGKSNNPPVQSQRSAPLAMPSQIERREEMLAPLRSLHEPHWGRGDGYWNLEIVEERTILRHI